MFSFRRKAFKSGVKPVVTHCKYRYVACIIHGSAEESNRPEASGYMDTTTASQTGYHLYKFEKPPVVETVLGFQFERLSHCSNAHLGAFWKSLGDEWPIVEDASPLKVGIERFGREQDWGPLAHRLELTQEPVSRLQIRKKDESRMVQVQRDALYYNWLGHSGDDYPSYDRVLPEFEKMLENFREFTRSEGFGDLKPLQWEVTYVNHIAKGTVWDAPADWSTVLPSLLGAGTAEPLVTESVSGEWKYTIPDNRGRLYVLVRSGRIGGIDGEEILLMKLTARGKISDKPGEELRDGLDFGHEVIVSTFGKLTSRRAHGYWSVIE